MAEGIFRKQIAKNTYCVKRLKKKRGRKTTTKDKQSASKTHDKQEHQEHGIVIPMGVLHQVHSTLERLHISLRVINSFVTEALNDLGANFKNKEMTYCVPSFINDSISLIYDQTHMNKSQNDICSYEHNGPLAGAVKAGSPKSEVCRPCLGQHFWKVNKTIKQ